LPKKDLQEGKLFAELLKFNCPFYIINTLIRAREIEEYPQRKIIKNNLFLLTSVISRTYKKIAR